MKTIQLLLAAVAGIVLASPAAALAIGDSDTVQFYGTVDTACDLSVAPGSLGLNDDGTVLSSRSEISPEGVSGRVTVRADENFAIMLGEPVMTSTSNDTDLSAATVGQLGQSDIEVNTPVAVPPGETEMTVDLEIERSGGGSLSGGDYTASVLVTCEPGFGPVVPQ